SRRRHTRFSRDWSSDVCSSDLKSIGKGQSEATIMGRETIGYLKLVDGTLKKILGNMPERETLKSRFRQVLDYYITQREALGWPVSAAKKEELAKLQGNHWITCNIGLCISISPDRKRGTTGAAAVRGYITSKRKTG